MRVEHAARGLVDQLVHDVDLRGDLPELVVAERRGVEEHRPALGVEELPVPPREPVRRLLREHRADLVGSTGAARWQVERPPVDAPELRCRRIPGVVRIGEAHPAEPVVVGAERVEPGDRPVGDPVGVVPAARDRVVLGLGGHRVATGYGAEERGEALEVLGVVCLEPPSVVRDRAAAERGDVVGLLGPVEAPPRTGVAAHPACVLLPPALRVERGLEVGLAEQRGLVPGLVAQVCGDAGGIDGQRDPVGDDAVGAHVLAGQHRAPCGHADGVLVVGAVVPDPGLGESVDDRCARDGAPVAAERVVALLVGRDEEDVATHADRRCVSRMSRLATRRPRAGLRASP